MHAVKVAAGMEEEGLIDKMCCKLTMKQRVIGYCCCFAFGSLINMFSWSNLKKFFDDPPEPIPFVMLFVLGNVIQLTGSVFLSGPAAYCRKLVGPTMRVAFVMYVLAMILTIVLATVPGIDATARIWIVLLMLLVVYICMAYFFICSIPFGKRMLCSCCKSYCGDTAKDIKGSVTKAVAKKEEPKKKFFGLV